MTRARTGKKVPPGLSLDVDLTVGPGITALYGPPGAGKTLLLECIAGFVRPDSGRILVEDAIVFDAESGVDLPPRRRNVGYVPRGGALFPHLTLRGNLLFAGARLRRLERHRRVNETLERFGIAGSAGLHPADAPPGVRLRCAIARALIAAPRLLLLDDYGMDEALLGSVREFSPCPVLMAAGDPDLCFAADALALIEAGRILQRGEPARVLDSPESPEAARLLGIANVFQASIAALDPGRGTSRLEMEGFALTGPYVPGHLRGDRVWVAVAPGNVRVYAAGAPAGAIAVQLVRAAPRARSVRLEFDHGIVADVPHREFALAKDNKDWRVEFPPGALRIL
jgi:molybdate transport system ATP-binding protein